MARINRRKFVQGSAAGVGLILAGTRASGRVIGANDRLRIAVAGLNGRGRSHMAGWMGQKNVEITYLIDPDENVRNGARQNVAAKSKGEMSPKAVADVREALADKTLDAISVATPNHWHSLITIWAAQAGKHVYVEKPITLTIDEGKQIQRSLGCTSRSKPASLAS